MQLLVVLKLLTLLTVANGAPVFAKNVLRDRFACPVDGGSRFVDQRRLFGPSKTVRGVVVSVVLTAACAPVLGLPWKVGATVGSLAMAGDLFSSFLKRRMALPAAAKATVLDQAPESLFPLLACRHALSLAVADIVVTMVVFFVGEIVVSRLLYKLHLRDRPY
jgi:hypothetical protein